MDSLMNDFKEPEELEKDITYPAAKKKRTLAANHAEEKLLERLRAANERLRAANTKVSIQRVGDSLILQATLPLKPGEISKNGLLNKQTKISLTIAFSVDGIRTAEEEASELGKLLARKQFVWNDKYLGRQAAKADVRQTAGELMEQFEKKYFEHRKDDLQGYRSFENHCRLLRRFLDMDRPLDDKLIRETIAKIKGGTSTRVAVVSALSVFANTFDVGYDFAKAKKGYKPKSRKLPSDAEIEAGFLKFAPRKMHPSYQWDSWRWAYGMIATYGLRPHELWALNLDKFVEPSNTANALWIRDDFEEGTKTGWRMLLPLHPRWVELFDLKNVKKPVSNAVCPNIRARNIARNFLKMEVGFQPYDLRHSFAIRGHLLGIPLKVMAANMGHDVTTHTETYLEHMSDDERIKAHTEALDKVDAAKIHESEVQMLKRENARLQAEILELRTLLTQQRLEEFINSSS